VVAGALQVASGYGLNATTGPLGNPQVARTVFVGTNAVLHLDGNDVLGQVWSHPHEQIVVSGGTLTQTVWKVNCFGPLTLDNATLAYSGRNGNWGTLVFDGDVTFKGTNAYNLANVNDSRIRCGRNRMTFFDVADIPGTNIDVTVGMLIEDCVAGSVGGIPFEARPSNLGKKGLGTLRLENHGSTFTGDVEVAEGILQIPVGAGVENKTYSCLGNPQVATRCCRVYSCAELSFLQSDMLGQLASSVKMATAISNATLRLADNTCNGFGPLTLHNARVVYNSGTQSFYTNGGVRTWGVMGFGGRAVFSGTNAYMFAVVGNYCRFNLGYALDYSEEDQPGVTNYNGKTEFVVRDISGDVRADVTFEAPLQDIPTWPNGPLFKTVTFKCGLLKSGGGTLRLASTDNTYTGPTVVTQGVLRVDGSLTSSTVTVEAGGYLGGTGTVEDVTLEEGAGIEVSANQTVPLTVATLTVAEGGTVVVHNPDGIDRTVLNAPLFRVTGSVRGASDLSAWRVRMEGVESTSDLRVRVDGNGIAYARWSPVGTLIKLF
jgi:autotransporter-associated beta strand protein